MYIIIEPRESFDRAIVKWKNKKPVYSYYRLIDVCKELYFKDDNPIDAHEMAIEWVEYNILPISHGDLTLNVSYDRKFIP